MTAHQFAAQLLAGPDLIIGLPVVKEYDTDCEDLRAPAVTETDGTDNTTDQPARILVISYK